MTNLNARLGADEWQSVICVDAAENSGSYSLDFYHEQEFLDGKPTNRYRITFMDLEVYYNWTSYGPMYEDLDLKEQLPQELQWYLSELYDV